MVVLVENDRLGVLEVPKKAVPVGTAAGFQLAPALKSKVPATGPATVASSSQVASCAAAGSATAISAEEASSAARRARDGATPNPAPARVRPPPARRDAQCHRTPAMRTHALKPLARDRWALRWCAIPFRLPSRRRTSPSEGTGGIRSDQRARCRPVPIYRFLRLSGYTRNKRHHA